jgi:hypothetical protein
VNTRQQCSERVREEVSSLLDTEAQKSHSVNCATLHSSEQVPKSAWVGKLDLPSYRNAKNFLVLFNLPQSTLQAQFLKFFPHAKYAHQFIRPPKVCSLASG